MQTVVQIILVNLSDARLITTYAQKKYLNLLRIKWKSN